MSSSILLPPTRNYFIRLIFSLSFSLNHKKKTPISVFFFFLVLVYLDHHQQSSSPMDEKSFLIFLFRTQLLLIFISTWIADSNILDNTRNLFSSSSFSSLFFLSNHILDTQKRCVCVLLFHLYICAFFRSSSLVPFQNPTNLHNFIF